MAALPPMFGSIIPGRLAAFDFQQVSERELVYTIPNCDSINHVVVFLTGSQPIPDGYAAGIYLQWPKPTPAWYLLGHISNTKPSAIYKISKPKDAVVSNMFAGRQMGAIDQNSAQIGISFESIIDAEQKTPSTLSADPSTVNSLVEFTQKMLSNVYNYCSSYAKKQVEMTPDLSETFIPMSAFQKWYETFQRRMTLDPNFWKAL